MSATEIPILDPKNIVVGIPNSLGGETTDMTFDPVAKLTAYRGGMRFEYKGYVATGTIYLNYVPEMNREDLLSGRYFKRTIDGKNEAVKIAELRVLYKIINDRYIGIVHWEPFRGIGFRPLSQRRVPLKEGGPDFEFWPGDISDRSKAVAAYLLQCLRPITERGESYQSLVEREYCSSIGIAVEQKVFDLVGKEAFPEAEPLDDDFVLILRGN